MRRSVRFLALTVTTAALAAPLTLSSPAHADPIPGLALDTTWGDGGVATAGQWDLAGEGSHDQGYVASSDGHGGAIVSLLAPRPEGGAGFDLVRLDEHGDLDPTFGGDGRVELPCSSFAIDADATSIAIVGYFAEGDAPSSNATCVGRLHSDGTPDLTFDGDAWRTYSQEGARVFPQGVQLGPDGSLTMAATVYGEEDAESTVVRRFAVSGAPDVTFGDDGVVDVSALVDAASGAVAEVDARGRTIVLVEDPAHYPTRAIRLTTTGALDPGWGNAGVSGDLGGVHDVGVSPRDGSLAAVSVAGDPTTVSRLGADGKADRRFGDGEAVDLNISASYRPAVAALADGHTVVFASSHEDVDDAHVIVLDDHGTQVAQQTIEDAGTLPFSAGWVSADGTRAFIATLDDGDGETIESITNIRSFVLDLPTLSPTVTSVTAGKGALEVSWTAAEDDNDGPVRAYEVQALDHGTLVASHVVAGDVRRTTVTGLTNGHAYDVVVRPYTAHGIGVPSASSTGTPSAAAAAPTPATAPVGATAAVGRRFATLSWAPPADDGGAPIIAYTVIAAKAGTTELAAFQNRPADARSASMPGLIAGQAYDLYVLAYTSAGYGELAKVTATPTNNPSAPRLPPEVAWSAGAPTATGVVVSWGPPIEKGNVTTGFAVVAVQDGTPVAAVEVGPNARSAALSVPGTAPVQVYVFAKDADVYGIAAGPVTVTR